MKFKAKLMDEGGVNRALMRISHEILERNKGADDLCILGIRRRGEVIAKRIAQNIELIEGVTLPFGELDISFYRDDLTRISDSPVVKQLELPFSIVGKKVIIADDVLYTGRTVRAAIEAVFSLGRPKAIELAVLIDRGHRELPIRADFVGKSIPTSNFETIKVMMPPFDDLTAVLILERDDK